MSSLENLNRMIEKAKALQGSRDPADDFTDEDAPQADPYDDGDDEEELEDEPQPITVKQRKPRREAAKLTVTLDHGAEALTLALRQLTTALNSIAPGPSAGAKPSELPPVKVSVTINVDASPLVERLTDGVRAATGGEREGALSKALRETLKDFNTTRVSDLLKKDASQFVKVLGRRLDEAETRPLEFHEEDDDATPVAITQPLDLPAPEPVKLTQVETVTPSDVTDEDAAKLVKKIKMRVNAFESEDRPKLLPILNRYGAGKWDDIPRDKLAEALDAVRRLMGDLYGAEE